MAENIKIIADQRPDEAALIDEQGETTWRELNDNVNRLIRVLRDAGLGTGSTVGILMSNRREYFEVLAACAHASMTAVPINWHCVAEEVEYVLDNSDAEALLTDDRFVELAAQASSGLDRLRMRVVVGKANNAASVQGGFLAYEEVLANADDDEPEDQGEGDVMFFTSGTTGRPKGVRRLSPPGGSLEQSRLRSMGFSALLGVPQARTTLLCGPLYHSAQWAFSYLPLGVGSTVVMRHKFVSEEVLELIDRYRITSVHLVPTQFIRLLRVDDETRDAFDGSSLELVMHGAAPCPPGVKRRMIEWWGPVVAEYYGGTEGAVISIIRSDEWLERPGSVGKPLPIVEVTVIAEDGRPADTGQPGQIYVRNQMAPDFKYHKEPGKTEEAHLGPGVFTMGDIGYLDEDGYLFLTDRKIDMIISGGVNIYPAEIEMTLGDHPAVRDVAVIGVPDEEYGEQVKAVVELNDGFDPSETTVAELIAHCRKHLAGYKAPKTIDFDATLPRHPTGKLYKRLLRERYAASSRVEGADDEPS